VMREKVNAWTVGLAAGLIEGAPIRLAAEMARIADDGPNMLVLPVVTRGPTENVNALLYLKGIDLAMINSDSLDEYKVELPDIRQHVTYMLNLFPSELHVFVRPEIKSLQDLAGKKVNFNTRGTAAAYSGPLMFSRLGINIIKTFIPHPVALQQMKNGEGDMAAVVFITSKPVDAFLRGKWEGFKFLPVTYDNRFEDYYLPATLEATDYPGLIPQGERIATVSVPTVMYSGRIVEAGTTAEVISAPRHPYTAGLLGSSVRTARKGVPLRTIPGLPPDLRRLPPGCSFAPRCLHAAPACQGAMPALAALEAGHLSRCRRVVEEGLDPR
jgi:oligopeptide/dipeptide ABC transporter ATP-binding protein